MNELSTSPSPYPTYPTDLTYPTPGQRGTLPNIDLIVKVNVMPGGTQVALLTNGQKLQVSRLQSRIIRERLLRL